MKKVMQIVSCLALVMGLSSCALFRDKPVTPETPLSDFPAGLQWAFLDASSWAKTVVLGATIKPNPSGTVIIDFNFGPLPKTWTPCGVDKKSYAQAWMIAEVNGKWTAFTFEFIGDNHSKALKGPMKGYAQTDLIPANWSPNHGQKIGIMISGFARGSIRSCKERSNVVWLNWP